MTLGRRRRSTCPAVLDLLGCALARMLYRVRPLDAHQVPPVGGAVLISNHLSYADVVALQLACPRPLRFLAYRDRRPNAFFEWVFRNAGVIPIDADRPAGAVRRAIAAARAGELVCLFAEGQISRTGQFMAVQRGFQVIARRAGVPVVPAAIDGLWGSVFSFSGNRYLWKSPRLMRTAVCVAFGRPAGPDAATVAWARQAILELWARAFEARPYLERHVAHEALRMLARNPGRVALVDRTAAPRRVTAAQAIAVGAALGQRWRRTVAEARVAVVLPPGAGSLLANLAAQCAGKVPVNLNFSAGPEAFAAALAQSGVRTVITADAMRARFPELPWPADTRDFAAEVAAAGGRRALLPWIAAAWLLPNQAVAALAGPPRRGGSAEAALLFTSGSAGPPKGVSLTHRNLLANCEQISSMAILPASAVLLGCLPPFHAFGLTVTLWYPLVRGCLVVTVPSPLDTRRIVEAIRDERATVLIAAPTFLRPILRKARPEELRSLEIVVAGAERLPDELYRAFREQFGLEVLQGYGLTETSPVACVNQPDPPATTATAEPQAGRRTGTVGRLLPGIAARIVDPETKAPRTLGEAGLVCLKGANVFGGYLGDPAATAAVLEDGWFRTGDLGSFDADGFLTIAGRLSRFSKIGGEMVPHAHIEDRLLEQLGVGEEEAPVLTLVGVPDPAKGETLALITTRELAPDLVRERLAAAGLPNLWLPRAVIRVERIPMLGSGKIDFRACQELARKAGESRRPG